MNMQEAEHLRQRMQVEGGVLAPLWIEEAMPPWGNSNFVVALDRSMKSIKLVRDAHDWSEYERVMEHREQ